MIEVLEWIECETLGLRTCYYSRHYHWYFESILPLRLILMHYHNSITHTQTESRFKTANISLYTHTGVIALARAHDLHAQPWERKANSSLTFAAREFEHNELQRERDNRAVKGGAKVCTYTREFQARCIVPVASATALHIFAFYQNTGRVFIPLVSGTKFV